MHVFLREAQEARNANAGDLLPLYQAVQQLLRDTEHIAHLIWCE